MLQQWEVRPRYGEPQVFDDTDNAATFITENEEYIDELEVDVDEYIDDCYGSIEICGERYYASRILYNLDEYRYEEVREEEKRNCAENNAEYVSDELSVMDDGDEKSFEGGISVVCFCTYEDGEDEPSEFDEEFKSIFEKEGV